MKKFSLIPFVFILTISSVFACYWLPLHDVTINEDSGDGVVVYENLMDYCVAGTILQITSTHEHYDLYLDGNDLEIRNLEPNYFDNGEVVLLTCNNQTYTNFTLTIAPVDDPAYWLALDDKTVREDSPDGTPIYENIYSSCIDIDSPINIQITSNHNFYDLYFGDDDLLIQNMFPDYNDVGNDVYLSCNGISEKFLLTVLPQYDPAEWLPLDNQYIEEDTADATVVYENLIDHCMSDGPKDIELTYYTNLYTLYVEDGHLKLTGIRENYYDSGRTITVNCDGVSSYFTLTVNPVDDPAYWLPLNNQTILEDSVPGVVVYPNLESRCVDIDSDIEMEVLWSHSHYYLYMDEENVEIRELEPNYNDDGEFITAVCNGINSEFLLTVIPVDDPAYWLTLENQQVYEDSPDATMVYPNIESRCIDIDSDVILGIDSQHDFYDLYFDQGNMRVRNMHLDYNDNGDYVYVDCNSIDRIFTLTVNPVEDVVWDDLSNKEIYEDSVDETLVYQNLGDACHVDGTIKVLTVEDAPSYYNLYFDGDDLLIENLEENYFDNGLYVTVGCNGINTHFELTTLPVDDPAIWSPLDDKEIVENAADGVVVYENIINSCLDPDDPIIINILSTNNNYDLYIDKGDIEIENLLSNYNDQGNNVLLDCNGVKSEFTLTVVPVYIEPYWLDIDDKTVNEDSQDGTTVYEDITKLCIVDEIEKEVSVYSEHNHYTLYLDGDDLLISNMEKDYDLEEIVEMSCNGAITQFLLSINPDNDPYWLDLTDKIVVEDSPDDTVIYEDIIDLCISDGVKEFELLSTHQNYNLAFSDKNLVISGLVSNYFDNGEQVIVSCNGYVENFTLTIVPANDGPRIISTPKKSIILEEPNKFDITYKYDVNAIDPDDEYLTYSLLDGPSGMVIDSVSGLILWVPPNNGDFPVRVQVSDGGLTDEQYYVITIKNPEEKTYPRQRVYMSKVRLLNDDVVRAGDEITMYFDFENIGYYDLEDIRVHATLMDMPQGDVGDAGVIRRGIGPKDIGDGRTLTSFIVLQVPEITKPGFYMVKVTVTDMKGSLRRVKYREFEVV